MKSTGQPRSQYNRKPRPAEKGTVYALTPDESLDITIGYGTIKYCTTAHAWLLPAGIRQKNRVIRCEKKARYFAQVLHDLITRNLSMSQLNSRLIAYGG